LFGRPGRYRGGPTLPAAFLRGGHITAASTPQAHPYGFVFLHCRLTGDPTPWVDPTTGEAKNKGTRPPKADIGRPWRPYGSVTYIDCEMGDHIKPEGWDNWRNPVNERTARYAEYNNRGPGAKPEKRVAWSKQLTKEEAAKLTVSHLLGGSDGWNPGESTATTAP
jgi:pectinesterase